MAPELATHAERDLVAAIERGMDAVRLLGRLSPTNARAERARLIESLKNGESTLPRWERASTVSWQVPPGRDFDALADLAEAHGPIGQLYAERARELGLEARLGTAIGTAKFGELARLRYPPRGAWAAKARKRARTWVANGGIEEPEDAADTKDTRTVSDDDRDPASLLSTMRRAVSERAELRPVYRVSVNPELVSLAATGEREIHIASGRVLRGDDVARTVMHEIEAHALPRARARSHPVRLFSLGTAGGTDDQEGRALLLEDRNGYLDNARRRSLARRHLACLAMNEGADFAEVTRHLFHDLGASAEEAVITAERVFRGSLGTLPGLGRERVYLEAYLEMKEAFDREPDLEVVMAAGQVSLRAAPLLVDHVVPKGVEANG